MYINNKFNKKNFMIKNLFILFAIFLFTACTSTIPYNYSSKTNELKFKISEENYFTKELNNPKYISTFDDCANESYLLKEERYFIEYISLDYNCKWNGLADGYFEREFKAKLKLKSMLPLERIDIKNYSFSTFKIDDKYSLNTITIYSVNSNIFIIDYDGTLYNELLVKLNPTYQNTFLSSPRFKADYKYSMVRFNILNSYFNREIQTFKELN